MASKRLKKIICLVLVIVTAFSLSVTAYASDGKSTCSWSQLKTKIVSSLLSHENLLTKSIVRAQFKTAAVAGGAVGCTTAASLLNHSLQNKPAELNCDPSSRYAQQIMRSSECKEIANKFRNEAAVKAVGKTEYTMSGSIALNSSPDLYLAYNSVNYIVSGTRNGDKWDLTITFTDTYDFEFLAWKDVLTDGAIIVAICNYAAIAQTIHAIVPYPITVTVKTSVNV